VLVIVGGYPGEWEGEHPFDTVQRLGAQDVFFVGWRGHEDLARILRCSDLFAAPGVDEPFGLVYLEAMAAGLPPIATSTGGPQTFINTDPSRPTGWLVPADDLCATTHALCEAISDAADRRRRGCRAAAFVRSHYSWSVAADSFVDLYDHVTA
jgi:glycosyltransferase involved in cell wall biosynthesis